MTTTKQATGHLAPKDTPQRKLSRLDYVFVVPIIIVGVPTYFPRHFPAHIIKAVFQDGSEIVFPLATLIASLRVIPAILGTAAA